MRALESSPAALCPTVQKGMMCYLPAKRTSGFEMRYPVLPFAIAALTPAVLLGVGSVTGGLWLWAGVIYVTLFAFALDQIIIRTVHDGAKGEEFPFANGLSIVLALAHMVLMVLAVLAVAGVTGLAGVERVGAFVGGGLYFGQISIANAHELIHRNTKGLFNLGKWVFISMLYGHVTTSHRFLHHAYVGTPKDPNFPPKGTSFYRYLPRSMWGNFVVGFHIEQDRARRSGRRNPYWDYAGGALILVCVAAWIGPASLGAYLGLCLYAQVQHAMVDYLQHYGLARRQRPDGSYAPQSALHSWNSPHWFSSLMTVNVTRHSDHHAHPARVFPALHIPDGAPTLPYNLPAMGAIAMIPPLWFKLMDKRADKVLARLEEDAS